MACTTRKHTRIEPCPLRGGPKCGSEHILRVGTLTAREPIGNFRIMLHSNRVRQDEGRKFDCADRCLQVLYFEDPIYATHRQKSDAPF